jgi:hypothetical protein
MADEPTGTAGAVADDPAPALETTPAATPRATDAEPQSFIDPGQLPAELKPHWTRMHRAYTKALEKARGGSSEAEGLVKRFWSDGEYAAQILQQRAAQLGYRLSKADARAIAQQGAQPGTSPAADDDGLLPPELKWMQPTLDRYIEARLGPERQRTQAKEVSARSAEYDEIAEELAETAPGWEAHEDDMLELLSFLQGRDMRHRRWGSKLALLHNLVTGQAHAVATLARRTADAARARTTTGQPGRSVAPNLSEQIRKAPTNEHAWELAAKAGEEEARRRGLA